MSFGGVCGVGEDWLASARRELAEEAGLVDVELTDLGTVRYEEGESPVIGGVYVVVDDRPITCDDGEVVEVAEIPLDRIERWVAERNVCPDSELLALPLVIDHLRG